MYQNYLIVGQRLLCVKQDLAQNSQPWRGAYKRVVPVACSQSGFCGKLGACLAEPAAWMRQAGAISGKALRVITSTALT